MYMTRYLYSTDINIVSGYESYDLWTLSLDSMRAQNKVSNAQTQYKLQFIKYHRVFDK